MPLRLPSYSLDHRGVRILAAVAVLGGYIGGFGFLTRLMGPSAAVGGFAAVGICAWLWGTNIGMLSGVVMACASGFLYRDVQHMTPTVGNVGGPLIVAIGLGALVGYLRDLRYKLLQQNATIRHQADQDPLTGLLNRSSLSRRFQRLLDLADPRSEVLAVLFIDLDRFKIINDTLGHATGDRVLRSVAARLREHTRGGDLLGRLGGDEFVAVLKGIERPENAMTVSRHVLAALAEPHPLGGDTVTLHASIGISLFPRDGRTTEDLISRADNAMYRVKWQGKNGVRYFGEGGREEAQRMRLSRDLRPALEAGAMRLVYQPIYDPVAKRVTSLEALLRWTHPELGPVPPPTIVEVAEEQDLTAVLGRQVLTTACRDARNWSDPDGNPPTVSVNVSPLHVAQPGFAMQVLEVLSDTGLDPKRLTLELTEEALLRHRETSLGDLAALRAKGVRIAIDDFGVGYSSLAYLRDLPADVLKLDRVFIEALDASPSSDASEVVRAVVSLGHALGKTVIAEGVETKGQYEGVASIGCDEVQGYYIARPAPLEDLDLGTVQVPSDDGAPESDPGACILRLQT